MHPGYSADTAEVDRDEYAIHSERVVYYLIITDQKIKSDLHWSGVGWLSGVKVVSDVTSISNLFHKIYSFYKDVGAVLTNELRTANFYTSVCDTVVPERCMKKMNILELSSYMSPLRRL